MAKSRSDWERKHQPAEDQRGGQHPAEHLRADDKLLVRVLTQQPGEYRRDAHGKDQHQNKVALHDSGLWTLDYFRPMDMSNASMTTRVFNRPATMRNVLPYS